MRRGQGLAEVPRGGEGGVETAWRPREEGPGGQKPRAESGAPGRAPDGGVRARARPLGRRRARSSGVSPAAAVGCPEGASAGVSEGKLTEWVRREATRPRRGGPERRA